MSGDCACGEPAFEAWSRCLSCLDKATLAAAIGRTPPLEQLGARNERVRIVAVLRRRIAKMTPGQDNTYGQGWRNALMHLVEEIEYETKNQDDIAAAWPALAVVR